MVVRGVFSNRTIPHGGWERLMKIIYFNNKEQIDEDIIQALRELNHKVIPVENLDFKEKADVFLFRNTIIPSSDLVEFFKKLNELKAFLRDLKCKKVLWFTDKIIGLGADFIEEIIPFTDKVFANDDTWVRRHDYGILPLHLAAGKRKEGKYQKKYDVDIAFNGKIHIPNVKWVNGLKTIYQNKFKLFNVQGQDFADLCVSAKILVFPWFPYDNFFWTEEIYEAINAGAFVIFPRTYGIDLEEKEQYVGYNMMIELVDAINWFLEHENERKLVVKQGKRAVREKFVYRERLRELLEKI